MGIAERIAITMIVIAKNFAMMSSPWPVSARLHESVERVISRPPRGGQTINGWGWPATGSPRFEITRTMTTYALSHRLRRGAKGVDRACLILLNIENCGQSGHLEQIMYSLVKIGEFQVPTLVTNRRVSLDQFPDSRTVDVLNFAQVQHDRFPAFFRQISNNLAENDISLSQRNSSSDVNDCYSAHLPGSGLHFDGGRPCHSNPQLVKNRARGSRKFLRFCPNHDQGTPLFENFAEERDVFRALFSRCRLRRVCGACCRRADGGARTRTRKPEQCGGAEPQREYRPDPRKKQRCSHNPGCHPGGSPHEASHKCADLFRDGFGFVF